MLRVLVLFMAVIASAFGADKPETLVEGGYDEQEMQAAISRARSELEKFIGILNDQKGSNFAVKVPIEDEGKVEHFWLTGISYSDNHFEGKIGNDPGVVSNVKFGQVIRVHKREITDWLFMRDGKMHGNYTLRPLLATMSAEEAAMYRSMLANP
jgi:uncharacterized protein YegJ (DUF2314 family)